MSTMAKFVEFHRQLKQLEEKTLGRFDLPTEGEPV